MRLSRRYRLLAASLKLSYEPLAITNHHKNEETKVSISDKPEIIITNVFFAPLPRRDLA